MPARFSDAQLIIVLQKSARRVNRRLGLFGTDEEIVVSSSGSITPVDGTLEDLVLLQSECMIMNIDVNSAISNAGVVVKDGEQTVDSRNTTIARINYLNSDANPCAELERQIKIEQMNRAGDSGKLVW